MKKENIKETVYEFLRYVIVGGISAIVDMAMNYITLFYFLGATKDDKWQVSLSVAVGFAVGITINFILANIFVFKSEEQREKGLKVGSFLVYTLIGIVGFGISVGLTLLGTNYIGDEGIWYLLLTCAVKGVVLIWNYGGRKIFVYRGK